jgi:hypothetical protein
MTNHLSDIVLGSAIIAAVSVAGYIIVQPSRTSKQRAVSAFHAKAWGKTWPQSKGTISKGEIDSETGSVDDDDEIYGLADKLAVPPNFNYWYFKEIQSVKSALGAQHNRGEEDVLVVREEYKMLRLALEDLKDDRSIVVTGHPGIGSYESWFSSLESNADFSRILRQEHLSLLPSFISS